MMDVPSRCSVVGWPSAIEEIEGSFAIRKADELVASGRIIVGSESGSPNPWLTTSHARGRRVKDNRKCVRACTHRFGSRVVAEVF